MQNKFGGKILHFEINQEVRHCQDCPFYQVFPTSRCAIGKINYYGYTAKQMTLDEAELIPEWCPGIEIS